jgi:hypothetical protein
VQATRSILGGQTTSPGYVRTGNEDEATAHKIAICRAQQSLVRYCERTIPAEGGSCLWYLSPCPVWLYDRSDSCDSAGGGASLAGLLPVKEVTGQGMKRSAYTYSLTRWGV